MKSKTTEPTDISTDLETLGKSFNSPILSIGAVKFNRRNGKITDTFYKEIDIDSAVKSGVVDGSTLQWWMTQSDKARELFAPGREKWSLATALGEFTTWVRSGPGQCKVWGNGSSFDITILEHAYRVGCVGLREGWHFASVRDVRTIVDAAEDVTLQSVRDLVPRVGTHHHALDDATYQAGLIYQSFKLLREHSDEEI